MAVEPVQAGMATSNGRQIEIGDEVLVNGRRGTVKMVGESSVRVEYRYGHTETVRKLEVQTEFEEKEVEEETISVEFERYTGKKSGTGQSVDQPKVRVSKQNLHFNKAAVEVADLDGYGYVNYYLSDDPDIFAVKPAEGGDVDGDSYRINDGSVSFTNVGKTLGLGEVWSVGNHSKRIDAKWDTEKEMFIIDVSPLRE